MKNRSRSLRNLLLLALIILLGGCAGKKETVNYEPRPDPFPKPDEESFSGRRQPIEEETAPPSVDTKTTIDQPARFELNTVYFEFDRSGLTTEARQTLAQNASQLLEHPDKLVRIEGHCDERGTVEYNLALGERRALAVRDYLINFGIAANRLSVLSYGKERPVDNRSTEQAWARNRRAEFVLMTY